MSKKRVAVIVVGVAVVFFILGAYFFANDKSNEAEDERTNEVENTKEVLEAFKKEEDFMTKEETSDFVNKYKSDAEEDGEDVDDWEIKEKLKEDHGIDVSISFEKGTMIDDDMNEDDGKQVMIKSFLEPVGLE